MKKKIILAAMMLFGAGAALAPAPKALAVELGEDPICSEDLDDLQYEAAGCGKKEVDSGNVVISIINWVIAILGIVAVLFVIIGGAQYMTSQGDPTKTKRGKDTILYAILGVVLAALAYTIVNFVIANIIK